VNDTLVGRAGGAMTWKAIQLASVKFIFLARTLVLARLLVPEDFGLLAVSLIAVDFLISITNFGLLPALVQRAEVEERHYHAAWTAGLLRAVAVALLVILAAPLIAALLAEPRAVSLIRVIALRPVLEAAASAKMAEVTRHLRFRAVALVNLPEALVNAAVSIALARPLGVWALVAGSLAGPAISGLMSYRLAPYRPRLTLEAAAVRPLLQFGRWIFLTSLVSIAARALLQVVITRTLGVEALGLYYLAAKLAFIPSEVSSDVVGAVAFPLYARLQADAQQVRQAFRALFTSVAALLFPACALLVVLAPALVTTILGPRWLGTAPLIQLLALVNGVGLLGEMAGPILNGMGRPDRIVVIELLQSSLLIFGIASLVGRYGLLSAGLAWLIAVSAAQFVSGHFIQQVLPKTLASLALPTLAIVLASGAGGLIASGITLTVPGLPGVVVAAGLGLLSIGILLWLGDRWFAFGLARGFLRVFPQIATRVGYSPLDA
jgi:lipopolysaccharide exporter